MNKETLKKRKETLKKWERKHWKKNEKGNTENTENKRKETYYKKIGNKHWKKYEGNYY